MKYAIVTTTYNDETGIGKYIENILMQTILPVELIIADGGSKDNTCKIINKYSKEFADKIQIKLYAAGRLNIAEGFNLAIKSSSEEIIGITGVGNHYPNDYFEKLLAGMKKNGCEVCYGTIRGEGLNKFQKVYMQAFLIRDAQCKIPCNRGVLIKKSVFQKIGFFYESFIYAGEDAEFFELAQRSGINMKYIDNAEFVWETPKNFKEYVKQTKNYTIAKLQMKETKKIVLNTITKILIIILGILFICFKPFISLLLLFLCGCLFLVHSKIKGISSMMLYLNYKVLTIIYTIRYAEYLKKKYKVIR